MKNKDIAMLVEKVQKDKENYFEELYKEIWKTVYYYCYKSLGNEQDAKDAMQTVFLQVYNKFDTLYHPNAFNNFLCTIMRYTCSNFHRAKFQKETEDLENYEAFLQEDNADFLPDEAYEKEEIRIKIAEIIGTLPAKQREAILLFYFEERSIKEIAEITESKFDAVNNRLVTARKTLRERAEALIKKGGLNRIMSIAPVHIITRILQDEAVRIATPEIGEDAWKSIAIELDLRTSIGSEELNVEGTEAQVASTVKAVTAINTAIYATITAGLAVCVFFAYYVYDNFIDTTPDTAYYGYAYEDIIDIEILIPEIRNREEFITFAAAYGFAFLGGSWTSNDGYKMLYYLEQAWRSPERLIYLGYTESLRGEFRLVYEIVEDGRVRMESDEVFNWFLLR